MGLVKGHAYTILNLYESPYNIVQLRNPWGEREWKGRCSDGDDSFWSSVSASDKQNMGYVSKNDGVFFMLW
jgi:hypothetical protein